MQICFYDSLKCIRRQYGLCHYVTETIHVAMRDTYSRIEISVSGNEKLSLLWDRGQLIVILPRTRIIKNTIFFGPKNEAICVLKILLNKKTQWYNYIEEVMSITNVNPNKNS